MAHIGRSTRRLEDRRLLTGQGRYANDIQPEGALHVVFCRSQVPHARISAVDQSAAQAMPGVVAVWTAEDLPEVAVGLSDFGSPDLEQRGRPILNRDEVNYAGEAYALVIAESRYEAQDAAEAVLAEFDPLPAVAGTLNAIAGGAPLVHGDMKSNIGASWPIAFGDIKAAFGDDAVVAKVRLQTDRVAGAAMEPRCVTAEPDAETGAWTRDVCNQPGGPVLAPGGLLPAGLHRLPRAGRSDQAGDEAGPTRLYRALARSGLHGRPGASCAQY